MFIDQALLRAVQIAPNRIATKYLHRSQTWAEFLNTVQCVASGVSGLGVKQGDNIGILALNSDYYLEVLFASSWGGAPIVPVNTRLVAREVAFLLDDANVEFLFVDDAFVGEIESIQSHMKNKITCIYMGENICPPELVSYSQLKKSEPVPSAEVGGETLAGLFYTGGTTGRSKGVMLSHDNIMSNAINAAPVMDYGVDTVYLHAAPMFHLADMASTYAVTLAGGQHCFAPRFIPQAVGETIEVEKITHLLLVPTMLNALVNDPSSLKCDFSSLRRMLYGASPMPEAVLLKAMEVLPSVGFVQGYGQTEASPLITTLQPEYHVLSGPKLTSAGQAALGVQVQVMDLNVQEVPRGSVGEICARGGNVMMGYWGLQDATNEALRGGWLHTGDMGYMDEDGFVFLVDRAKDMIISGGENVYSIEVEDAIYKHSAIKECAVIGIPSDKWGEQVHAIVVLRDGASLDEAELITHCKEYVAGYKCPRSVLITETPLPVSGAGKILKNELRKPWWEGLDKAVN
ncbi:fatty-acid--CoA ligase [Gammaproteobacteria bacterium 42_54_T18]|nr:fatty-acid--CoA ligase [Gammaproteobacteria bacterium 42_54_T18]